MSLIALPIVSYAQKDTIGLNIPVSNGKVIYEGVVTVPNKSKSELYKNSKQWFVDFFKSSKSVIQVEDRDDGRIAGKGIVFVTWTAMGTLIKYSNAFTVQIDVKDDRYRYRFYDMVMSTETQELKGFFTVGASVMSI